jgi:4-hydroxy-tetrahydrodipicolinate synthase
MLDEYKGITTALTTPFAEDGSVDAEAFERQIEFQIQSGVSALLVSGGTGEYVGMSADQRVEAIACAHRVAAGRVPVMAGVLEAGFSDAIQEGLRAKDAGADSLLVITPYYTVCSQENLFEYYAEYSKQLDMPIFLYDIPYKTYIQLSPSVAEKLVDQCPHIVGIKECTSDLSIAVDTLNRLHGKSIFLSGEEFLVPAELMLGADGAVMASANVVPQVWVDLYQSIAGGDYQQARSNFAGYFQLFKHIFQEPNPVPLKYLMQQLGADSGRMSFPLGKPSDALQQMLKDDIQRLGL